MRGHKSPHHFVTNHKKPPKHTSVLDSWETPVAVLHTDFYSLRRSPSFQFFQFQENVTALTAPLNFSLELRNLLLWSKAIRFERGWCWGDGSSSSPVTGDCYCGLFWNIHWSAWIGWSAIAFLHVGRPRKLAMDKRWVTETSTPQK